MAVRILLAARRISLARIHRRDAVLELTWGMMGGGRRTGLARSPIDVLRVVRGGHAGGDWTACCTTIPKPTGTGSWMIGVKPI